MKNPRYRPSPPRGGSVWGAERTTASNSARSVTPGSVEKPGYLEHTQSHANCIVCGTANPISLGLKFQALPDGSAVTHFHGSSLFQGYRGILHGGIIAALLDATMTHCLFYNGIRAVTGDLQIRFLKPVPCSAPLALRGWITMSYPPLHKVDAEILCHKERMATAAAKFMETVDPAAE